MYQILSNEFETQYNIVEFWGLVICGVEGNGVGAAMLFGVWRATICFRSRLCVFTNYQHMPLFWRKTLTNHVNVAVSAQYSDRQVSVLIFCITKAVVYSNVGTSIFIDNEYTGSYKKRVNGGAVLKLSVLQL